MRSSSSTIIDFDGTLVYENSSRVLEQVILEQSASPLTQVLYHSRFARSKNLAFATLSRLLGRRDARLFVLLWLSRQLLRHQGPYIYQLTAQRLTPNTELAVYTTQPFIVLSTGLQPVIEAYLRLNPQLPCTSVIASRVPLALRHFHHLLPPRAKLTSLIYHRHYQYFTDYEDEANLLEARLPWSHQRSIHQLKNGTTIHILTTQE